jgi:hypothetical protein
MAPHEIRVSTISKPICKIWKKNSNCKRRTSWCICYNIWRKSRFGYPRLACESWMTEGSLSIEQRLVSRQMMTANLRLDDRSSEVFDIADGGFIGSYIYCGE